MCGGPAAYTTVDVFIFTLHSLINFFKRLIFLRMQTFPTLDFESVQILLCVFGAEVPVRAPLILNAYNWFCAPKTAFLFSAFADSLPGFALINLLQPVFPFSARETHNRNPSLPVFRIDRVRDNLKICWVESENFQQCSRPKINFQ